MSTVAIDLRALCRPGASGVDAGILSDVLEGLSSIKQSSLLFREEVYSLFDYNDAFVSTRIWELLSGLNLYTYDNGCSCDRLTIEPDITQGCPDDIKEEETLQCSYFHRNGIKLFISILSLWPSDKQACLKTIKDKKARTHPTCIIETVQDWENYLSQATPCLMQLKHTGTAYQRGATPVASFSSYDKWGEQPAKDLLRQAYVDYQGEEQYPKHLYTWDANAGLYVKFNNSRSNEYHGYDLQEAEWGEVPSYIRNMYHH